MNRREKELVVSELNKKIEGCQAAILTHYRGLNVEQMNQLRRRLREEKIYYQVVKNTLARLAFSQTPHNVLGEKLKYSCAVAFGYDDPVVAAKVVVEFAKKNDKFSVRCASLNGKLLDEAAVKALSDLPSREQLLAQVLGTMNAVPQNFVCLFANVLRGMLNVLSALKGKKEQE